MDAISMVDLSRRLQARGLTRRADDVCNSPSGALPVALEMTLHPSNDAPDAQAVRAMIDATDARVFRVDRAMRLTWANRASRERSGLGGRLGGALSEVFDAPKRA